MKILFICEEYPPGKNGGIGTMVQLLAREMVAQGHSVYVIGLYIHGYGGADYEEDHGVKVWRLRYLTDIGPLRKAGFRSRKRLLQLLKFSLILQLDTLISLRRLFRRVQELVREKRIDIVEIPDWNTFFQNSFLPVRVPAFGAPLLVKFNGSDSYFRQELGLPVRRYVYVSELALMHQADALSAVSAYTAKKTAALFNLTRPIKILYNSIKLPGIAYPTKKNNNKIVFTGSLIYKKGIFSLLKAWNSVALEHPNAVLDIYGKGDIEDCRRVINPDITASVRFHGHVTREDLFASMAEAAAAVFPSYSECFAFAPMEAMAVGCAVINTNRSSGSELIRDGVDGLLVDPDNVPQIAQAISRLLKDDVLREALAEAGKKTVEARFDIRRSVPEHISFYQNIIDAP